MDKHCFWILTDGVIVKPNSRHILAVVATPELFGETKESLQNTFEPYGQGVHSNFEGKAREDVLLRVIRRNHIRIRKNQSPRNQHWSIQLYSLTKERQAAISAWATYINKDIDDKFADVIIHQFHDGSKFKTSLETLLNENKDSEDPKILTQHEAEIWLSMQSKKMTKQIARSFVCSSGGT
jgi:hypothetical protein